jgi:hypothetical protein
MPPGLPKSPDGGPAHPVAVKSRLAALALLRFGVGAALGTDPGTTGSDRVEAYMTNGRLPLSG